MAVFLFTGPSATGKSTLAKTIGARLKIPVIGEREDILRSLAHAHGFSRTRLWVQRDGIQTVLNEALDKTTEVIRTELFANPGGVILDGCYDQRLLPRLRQELSGEKMIVVAVSVDDEIRKERMRGRLKTEVEEAIAEMGLIDGFKYGAGMGAIINRADWRIDNSQDGGTEAILREWLGRFAAEIYAPFGKERTHF